jgi:hypothetical protein
VTKIIAYFKQNQQQTGRFAKGNRGLSFITVFLILLFASAFLLEVGLASWAESTATVGYFALAFSLLLPGRHRSKNGVVFDGPG